MEELLQNNWLTIAVTCVQVLWGWLVWSLRKQFVSMEEHAEARKQQDDRMGGIENEIDSLTRRADMTERDVRAMVRAMPSIEKGMNDLGISVERLRGEVMGLRAEMSGQKDVMKAIERQLSLLMENELRGARDGD